MQSLQMLKFVLCACVAPSRLLTFLYATFQAIKHQHSQVKENVTLSMMHLNESSE